MTYNPGARAPRCTLVNTASGASLECKYNPATISERIQVKYVNPPVLGQGRARSHFLQTGTWVISNLKFYVDHDPDSSLFRTFLLAFTRPVAVGRAPPLMLLLLPGFATFEARVTSLDIETTRFGAQGQPLTMMATLSLDVESESVNVG